jgi:DNA-binding NtrC family response regulator
VKKEKMKTILIVEDEPSISQVCSKVLSRKGYKVDIATNAKIAQEILETREYDLCLLDIRTPTMNGIELYQWLMKEHPEQANRIIFTSGYTYNQEADETLSLFDGQFLAKPFTIQELQSTVGEFFKEAVR